MVVNFEFLGMESVENVITCMYCMSWKQSQGGSAEGMLRRYW